MTAYAILSGTLARVEVVPATGRGCTGKHRVVSGALRAGRLIVLGVGPWQATEAEAWEHEARRLDALADRRAQEARRASIEAGELEGQARGAMAKAQAARGAMTSGGAA